MSSCTFIIIYYVDVLTAHPLTKQDVIINYVRVKTTYPEALSKCQDLGMHLLTIHNQEEANFIKSMLKIHSIVIY